MTKDFAEFLAALNKNGVRYVVIGGMAVLSHIPYRTTRDLDVFIEPTRENAEKTRQAVKEWGGFEPRFPADEFIAGDVLSFGDLLRVEIHSRVPGITWDTLWENREAGELLGVPTSFAAVGDLIKMKAAAGRVEKDVPDLRRLRELQRRDRSDGD